VDRRAAHHGAEGGGVIEVTVTEAPVKSEKTKVHNERQLRDVLKLSAKAWEKARWAKLVPDADRAAGTWSGDVVDGLLELAEEIRAASPELLDEDNLQKAGDAA
jgi:hypothetical protein